MALDVSRMVTQGHLIHDDVKQFADLLTGVMTDQPVTITNRLALSGNLTFSADNTYDIGAAAASRPRYVYAATALVSAFVQNLSGDLSLWPSGNVNIGPAFSFQWVFVAGGNFHPAADNASDIGQVANRPRTVYAATSFIGPGAVPPGGASGQVLSKSGAGDYALAWITPSSGGGLTLPLTQPLTWSPDNTYDIGASGASRPRNLYLAGTSFFDGPVIDNGGWGFYIGGMSGANLAWATPQVTLSAPLSITGYVEQNQIAKPANPAANTMRLYPKNDGKYYSLSSSGVETPLGGGGLTLPLTQPLTFSPDNTYDIGAAGASRPRNLYLGGAANVGGALNVTGTSSLGATTHFYHVTFSPDNTYDIGASGATRPRNLYLAGNEVVAGTTTIGGGSPLTSYGVDIGTTSAGALVSGNGVLFVGSQKDCAIYRQGPNDMKFVGLLEPDNVRIASNNWLTWGDANHGIQSGGMNSMVFQEYGGVWSFYSGLVTGQTLIAQLTSTSLALVGTNLTVGAASPDARFALKLGVGTVTSGAAAQGGGFSLNTRVQAGATNDSLYGGIIAPTFIANGMTNLQAMGWRILSGAVPAGFANAVGLYVDAPSGASGNNWCIGMPDNGKIGWANATLSMNGGYLTLTGAMVAGGVTPTASLVVFINGVARYIPYL